MDYKNAGVDIEAGYKSVELMKDAVKSTFRPEVLGGIGGFSGAFSMAAIKDMEDPVLLSGTDGCGTKVKLAFLMDKHDTIGIDCVAMCVNDVACAGGGTFFFFFFFFFGNVMCSRGSVIPLWIDQIKAGNPITVTEPSMTRFIMSLEEAVDLVLFAFEKGENGDLLIMKAPACTIGTQAEAVCELFGGKKEDIKVIGIRHGEKMYETLLTNEECAKAIDLGGFYRVPADNRGLNYDKYFKDGDAKRNTLTEFNSNNTRMLNLEETKATIAKLAYIQERLAED